MRVLVVDDDVTSIVVVAHAVMAVCGATAAQAWSAVQQTHQTGNAEVGRYADRESAEQVAVGFLRYGVRAVVLP